MTPFIRSSLAALALSLVAHGASATVAGSPETRAAESFHVALRIDEPSSRDFEIVLKVAQHGEVEVAGDESGDGGVRLGVTLVGVDGAATSPFRRAARLQLSVHEQMGGAWVLRGEKLLEVQEGMPTREAFSSSLGALGVSVIVNGEARTSPLVRRPAPMLPGAVASLRQVCCTSACRDGSGQTLRCCVSGFSCAGCGTSCSGEDP